MYQNKIPIISIAVYDSCLNTDNGAKDSFGNGCDYYDYESDCGGNYDDDDFKSDLMCCACGGGATKANGKLTGKV